MAWHINGLAYKWLGIEWLGIKCLAGANHFTRFERIFLRPFRARKNTFETREILGRIPFNKIYVFHRFKTFCDAG